LLVCEDDLKLIGLLTDGDIRRAFLRSVPFETACGAIASRDPVVASPDITQAEALRLMNMHDVNHLPLVDADRRIMGFLLRRDLVPDTDSNLAAVVMAGGFGTRLRPLTDQTPKPMLAVGDRPLLELTIEALRKAGIHRVSLTTHYLSEKITDHFGDGRNFGVELNYVNEDNPLGTAGGLKLMKNFDEPLLVINGDILTGVPLREMLTYHREHRADATVGVRKYEVEVPYGVVECEGTRVNKLKEKPSLSVFINAGMYLLEPSVRRYIPDGQRFDMTDLIQRLLERDRPVVSFPIVEYWLDVGRPADYQQAQEDVRNGKI
jgi:NDP-sugar pyrophosphorylase family protein